MRQQPVCEAVTEGEVKLGEVGQGGQGPHCLVCHLPAYCEVQTCQAGVVVQRCNPCTTTASLTLTALLQQLQQCWDNIQMPATFLCSVYRQITISMAGKQS